MAAVPCWRRSRKWSPRGERGEGSRGPCSQESSGGGGQGADERGQWLCGQDVEALVSRDAWPGLAGGGQCGLSPSDEQLVTIPAGWSR